MFFLYNFPTCSEKTFVRNFRFTLYTCTCKRASIGTHTKQHGSWTLSRWVTSLSPFAYEIAGSKWSVLDCVSKTFPPIRNFFLVNSWIPNVKIMFLLQCKKICAIISPSSAAKQFQDIRGKFRSKYFYSVFSCFNC